MIKKVWILLLSLFTILWIWVIFANPIWIPTSYCYKIKNVEIDNYRVIIEKWGSPFKRWKREVYEPNTNSCTKCSDYDTAKIYLLDKSIDIKNITKDNITNMSIYIWDIKYASCLAPFDTTFTYDIINSWNSYTFVLNKKENNIAKSKRREKEKAMYEKIGALSEKQIYEISLESHKKLFPHARLIAILTETLILFTIAKLFRKKDKIPSRKLILFWILPTTITLPFLRFVLPLIIEKWLWYTIIWELSIIIIEAIIIKYWLKISRWKAIIASVICNAASYGVWLLIL